MAHCESIKSFCQKHAFGADKALREAGELLLARAKEKLEEALGEQAQALLLLKRSASAYQVNWID